MGYGCDQVRASEPQRRIRLEIVVPDVLGDLVVHGAHGQDVVIGLHEGKEQAPPPHRRLKAAFKRDAFQESTYILRNIVKAHTLGRQNIEQTKESAAAWIFAGKIHRDDGHIRTAYTGFGATAIVALHGDAEYFVRDGELLRWPDDSHLLQVGFRYRCRGVRVVGLEPNRVLVEILLQCIESVYRAAHILPRVFNFFRRDLARRLIVLCLLMIRLKFLA